MKRRKLDESFETCSVEAKFGFYLDVRTGYKNQG